MRVVCTVVLLLTFLTALAGAQTPADAPSDAAPQIRLGGYIQYDYLAPLGDQTEAADTFRFRRVRLLGNGAITEKISWTVSAEATATPILRDAYLTLKYFPAAVTNGTRQNVSDDNNAKDAIVRLMATPRRLGGLQLGVNAMKGDQPDGMRTRTGADLSFERRLFHIAAEVDRERTGRDPRKFAAYVFGAWRIYPHTVHPGFHHLEFGTRFGRTRNLSTPASQWDLSANYYVHPNLRFMCS